MPPPPNTAKRMTANPVRPMRYRPGKQGYEEETWSDASDSSEDEQSHRPPPPKATSFPRSAGTVLKTGDLVARAKQARADEARAQAQAHAAAEQKARDDGFVTDDSASDSDDAGPAPTHTTAPAPSSPSSDEDDDDDDASSSDASTASSSSSSRPRFRRPIFMPKAERQRLASAHAAGAPPPPTAARKTAAADALVAAQIEKARAARHAARRAYDDPTTGDAYPDDTDGLDAALERAQWVARTLARLQRGRAALREREAALAEAERRAGLTEAQRDDEDMERVREQQEARRERAPAGFLQRTFHKGAFHQDEEAVRELAGRAERGARVQDDTDKALLPRALQMRDQTKIGKKGATRYVDMRSEDTGRFGEGGGGGRRGEWVDERYRPDGPGGRDAATGANAGGLGKRKGEGEDREGKRARVEETR